MTAAAAAGGKPVAIVTGAGKGIGRATAIELARAGYHAVAVARTLADVQSTCAECDAAGSRGLAIAADVSSLADVERAVRETLAAFGRIDAVVNNAGFAPVRTIDQMTPDEWHRVLETNLSATFYFSRGVWPIFKRQGGGVIVNISSLASRDPFPGFFAYGAAKAGINLMGLDLARQGEPHGIRVHTIAPGAVETSMFRGLASVEQYPKARTMDPAEVARVVVACIRGDLAYTSGEVIWLHKRLT